MKKVLFISGKLSSGKNQVYDFIKEYRESKNLPIKRDYFAFGVKNACKEDFKPLADYLNKLVNEMRTVMKNRLGMWGTYGIDHLLQRLNISDENWFENKTEITRIILQQYGTDIFRNRVSESYWANQVADRISQGSDTFVVLTDGRFPSEIEVFDRCIDIDLIKIRINRDIPRNSTIHEHESETALDNYEDWDYVINNNGTLDELKEHTLWILGDIESN